MTDRGVLPGVGWAAAALLGCGGDLRAVSEVSEGSAGSSSSSTTSSTTISIESSTESDSSTGVPGTCWREIEGNLIVNENTDLTDLADVRVVTGFVTIRLRDSPTQDLSFLGCLESTRLLDIASSPNLVSTRGMLNLRELGSLVIDPTVPSLVAIEGFDAISEIDLMQLTGSSLVKVEFPALRVARTISYPSCDITHAGTPLVSNGNFGSLESLEFLHVKGQLELTRVTILDTLIANGAAPPQRVEIYNNPMLPTVEVEAQLTALGVPDEDSAICGGLGEEPCVCPPES